MKLSLVIAGTASSFIALSTAGEAYAQESYFQRDRYTAVTDRVQSEYDPISVRIGTLEAQPELELGAGYRSNLFASTSNEQSDTQLRVAPSVGVSSNWSRHSLNASAYVSHNEYVDNGSESVTDYGGNLGLKFDVSVPLKLTAGVTALRRNEPRSAPASNPLAVEPVPVNQIGANLGAAYETGRIQLSTELSLDQFDYDDVGINGGGTLDQDFRDHDVAELRGRAAYAVNRDLAVFGEAIFVDQSYDAPVTLGQVSRDSQGRIIRAGVNFELPVLIRGDIAIGHQTYEFDDPSVGEVEGLSIAANAQWFVSQLVTVSATAQRSVEDPGIANEPAGTVTAFGVRADYEARRNVLLFVEANTSNLSYDSINREDDRIGLGAGATWKLNRNVWVETSIRHTTQNSDFQDFSDTAAIVALKLYP